MRGQTLLILMLLALPLGAQAQSAEPEVMVGKYQLGARVRGIFVTHDMLKPWLAANTGTSMESWSVGMEFTYRLPSFDVVTSVDFSWLAMHDGNFTGAGHDPVVDTHYTQFRNLSFISADVALIGYHKFLPWLELRYGGGLGIGYVPGDVLLINNSAQRCTAANAADPTQCYPISDDPTIGALHPGSPDFEDKAKRTETGAEDTPDSPHRRVATTKPPVMGVVNLLVGLRFYPVKRLAVTYELGFRNAIFTGINLGYLF